MSPSTRRRHSRIAILFPADPDGGAATALATSRLAFIGDAFALAGADVVSAPYADTIASETARRLEGVDAVLVWYNPFEHGRDRTRLNRLLRDVAASGALVSAHPDAIDAIGTKDVLFRTRDMGWGTDTRHYASLDELRADLPHRLALGARVLKQMRGQSGDGVWRVAARAGDAAMLDVRHAKRGSAEESMPLESFLDICAGYFARGGGMIEQPYQERLREGMIRCYVVGTKVAGFGEQLVNALYPADDGGEPPVPGPRLYFPPTRADFQPLKVKLEAELIPELVRQTGLDSATLPVLWDVDFIKGSWDERGADTYVLCEINVSSVYPFPPSALEPLVRETLARIAR